jgi:DNA-binding PadR family transcriptional regulator
VVGKVRKYYEVTPSGRKALNQAIIKVNELMNEIKF